jgi:putative peptidoglycan lipid II flippase
VALTPRLGIASLVVGVLLGGALQLALQLAALRRDGTAVMPVWQPSHPALGAIWRLLAPATLGTAMYQINVLLSTTVATLLPAGCVSALWYAGRLLEFPIGLVAVALGTAALPSFAEQAARQAQDEMRAASASPSRSPTTSRFPRRSRW